MDGNFSARIGARISEFMARMQQVQNTIRNVANDVTISINVNATNAHIQINAIEEQVSNINADVNVNANTTQASAQLALVEEQADDIEVDVDVNANTAQASAQMAIVEEQADHLDNRRIIVRIEARINKFQQKIQRIATSIRAFGELMQHTLMGTMMAVFPMISPLIANIVVALANLGPMIGTVAGSTFALAGAFVSAGAGAGAFAAVAIPTIKKLFDENVKLNSVQKAAKGSFDAMKKTYQDLVKETEKPVLKAFTCAMLFVDKLLKSLQPLFISSAQAMSSLMQQLNATMGTSPLQNFLDYLNKTGAPMLKTVTRSMGNVLQGLFSMLTAFAPLTASTAKGFEEMTARFAEWSNGLSGSSKFQSFMDYVNTNMPKIRAIFRDATAGIVYFFSAFGGSSSDMMTGLSNMMARFKEWSASLSQNQGFQTFLSYVQQTAPSVLQLIGNLTKFLVNLGIGMAPVGAGLMNIVNNILEFMNSGMESNRVIGVLLASFISIGGVLLAVVPNVIAFRELFKGLGPAIIGGIGKALPFITGLFTNFGGTMAMIGAKITSTAKLIGVAWGFITSPIGLVIIGITAVIAIFVKMYKTNEEFRGNVQKIWHSISKVISDATTEIKNVITKIWVFVTDFWSKNQKNILGGVKSAWSLIEIAINYSLKNIMSLFQIFWPIISGVVKIAWNLIKSTVQIGLNLVSGIIKTVTSLIQGDWQGAWSNIKQTAINIWNSIESFFRNINLFEIGKNIIQGLIKGINSMWENVKKTAAGIADLIPDWLKKKLGIHSPSRVMAKVSKWIPAGVATGIYNSLDYIKKSAEAMSRAAIPNFQQTVKATTNMMDSAKKILASKTNEIEKEIKTVEAEYAKKKVEATKKSNNKIAEINAKANDKKKKLTAAQQRQILKLHDDEKSALEKIEKDKAKKIDAIRAKSAKEQYDKLKEYAEHQVGLEKWSTKEQAAYWQYATSLFKEGTEERIKAQIEYNKSMAELTTEQFNKEKDYVDRRKKYNLMSLTQELAAYEKYVKAYKVGSEERIYYEDKIAETKQAIHDRLMTLNEEHISKIKDVQQAEIDGVKELQKAYQDAEDARTKEITSAISIFDEFERKTDVFGSKLIENLRGQVDAMRDWATDLQMLASKGIDKGLLAELQALGPNAQAEISALNKLSTGELNEYENLWKEKTQIARQQAQFELTGQRKEMTDQIEKLQTETKSKLTQYQTEWVEQVKQIREGTKNEFNPMISSMKEIGINAIEGLRNGLASQVPALQAQANEIANTIDKTIRKALQIKSPSRVLEKSGAFSGQGIIQGLASTKGMLENTVRSLTDIMQTDISAASIGLSTALNGGMDSHLLNSYELTSSQDQIGILKQIAALISKLDFVVELDGDVISEYVDRSQSNRVSSRRTTIGKGV